MRRATLTMLALGTLLPYLALASDNVILTKGGWTLKPAPKVEGVFLLQQGKWPREVIDAFHKTPFLDGASIRMKWSELEPADEQFDWSAVDEILNEVKAFNERNPGQPPRTFMLRVMAGVHSPQWFESAGVRYYDTHVQGVNQKKPQPLHIPMPYENPEFLKQLREVYQAMLERYKDDPLVVMYHGTWSAGPWDEIFHPSKGAPLPPDYSPQKFIDGMKEQLDVLIDEISLKGKPAELPWSGHQPPFDVQGPLRERVVERLGRRSPFFYPQGNGWGANHKWIPQPNKGKEVFDLNYGYQAVGTNAGKGWIPQGDWIPLVRIAQENHVPYVEIYPPDVMPVDDAHNMTTAFTYSPDDPAASKPATSPAFIGYRPWLRQRDVPMYHREGTLTRVFTSNGKRMPAGDLVIQYEAPEGTSVFTRGRMKTGGNWSEWVDGEKIRDLPEGAILEIEVQLHTDDGWRTPIVRPFSPEDGWGLY